MAILILIAATCAIFLIAEALMLNRFMGRLFRQHLGYVLPKGLQVPAALALNGPYLFGMIWSAGMTQLSSFQIL